MTKEMIGESKRQVPEQQAIRGTGGGVQSSGGAGGTARASISAFNLLMIATVPATRQIYKSSALNI